MYRTGRAGRQNITQAFHHSSLSALDLRNKRTEPSPFRYVGTTTRYKKGIMDTDRMLCKTNINMYYIANRLHVVKVPLLLATIQDE